MQRMKDTLPAFYAEVKERLEALGEGDLISQLDDLRISGRCPCGQGDCSTFGVTGGASPLSLEEQANRGPYLNDSLDIEAARGLVVVDTDHLRRIVGFEVLNRDDVHAALNELSLPDVK